MKVYLDHSATTPVDPRVVAAMAPYWGDVFGNASSLHAAGRDAEDAVALARHHVARAIGARPDDLVLTSGGTESNNLALRGVLAASPPERPHLVTTSIEHPSVLAPARALEEEGACDLTVVPPDGEGVVDPEAIRAALRDDTALVSVMSVNNETGAIQPVEDIAAICRERKIPVHTDAVQALGKIPLDLVVSGVDLASLSAHKVYGPKGVGALWVRRGVPLRPILHGGEQQRGRRPGTLPTPLVVGFGEAARLSTTERRERSRVVRELEARLVEGLESLSGVRLNGPRERRVPHTINVTFANAPGDALLMQLDQRGISVSTGSACASGSARPSPVLMAMGLSRDEVASSIRFGLGHENTSKEIDFVLNAIAECVDRLRDLRSVRRRR